MARAASESGYLSGYRKRSALKTAGLGAMFTGAPKPCTCQLQFYCGRDVDVRIAMMDAAINSSACPTKK